MTKEYQQPSDDQVSVRAYYLWEREGRPQGRDYDYWIRAKEELVRETSRVEAQPKPTALLSEPKSAAKKKASRTAAFA